MVKPGAINKKKNVFAGNHKSRARRAMKGRAKELNATKEMTETQRRKRLTNPVANVNFSKKKQRLMNKGKKPADVEMDEADEEGEICFRTLFVFLYVHACMVGVFLFFNACMWWVCGVS